MTTRALTDTNRRTGKAAWLNDDAAASYERAKARGLPGGCISDAGRTRAEQQALYDAWLRTGKRNPPSVAKPGTSLHEKGNALDLAEPARAWMHKRGREHGWINPEWAKRRDMYEPWHFEYAPSLDLYPWRKIAVDGSLGPLTMLAICRATGRRVQEPRTTKQRRSFWKWVQRQINREMKGVKGWVPLVRDGDPGPKTIRGLQQSLARVNPKAYRPRVDGSLGPETVRAWQYALNRCSWGRTKKQING
jgi:D-alanyl-D-alanine carboxypeptidase